MIASPVRPALLLFTLASLIAIAFGAVVMIMGDIPLSVWVRNPIAWAVAAIISLGLMRVRTWSWAPPAALALIALSFLGPEQEGVHRWLGFGPIQLNAAALVLPAAIAAFTRTNTVLALGSFAFIAAALALQPDISQLAGLAPAAIILCTARFGWKGAAASALIAAVAIALCLSRPDPLDPVEHVEGIFLMAWDRSPVLAVAMAASLAAAAVSPLLFWKDPSVRWPATALAAYFSATALAPLAGAYPVALAGYGLSFVIGWWLGFSALCALGDCGSRALRQ